MKKSFVAINIPADEKRPGETNEEAFLRIIDTWKGEYVSSFSDYENGMLGAWVTKYMKRFNRGAFPCAWIEDENGNIIEYFIFSYKGKTKVLLHRAVEV